MASVQGDWRAQWFAPCTPEGGNLRIQLVRARLRAAPRVGPLRPDPCRGC